MEELAARITAALTAGLATPLADLQALLLEAGGEHCHRRERITYLLQRFLTSLPTVMAAPSTTHRFKSGFHDTSKFSAIIETPEGTKAVNASNLTDEDVPLVTRFYGHFLEEIPADERPKPADIAADLGKLKKDELQTRYKDALGVDAPADMLKEDLIKAIVAGPKKD